MQFFASEQDRYRNGDRSSKRISVCFISFNMKQSKHTEQMNVRLTAPHSFKYFIVSHVCVTNMRITLWL
jgi:hypothetical protein